MGGFQRRQQQSLVVVEDRFLRKAENNKSLNNNEECILQINGMTLDVSKWARAHPGGQRILQKFHGKDATKAFTAVGHSDNAHDMLTGFCVGKGRSFRHSRKELESSSSLASISSFRRGVRRVKTKLFTKEDPWMIHKSLGLFSLCHFAYRFYLLIFDTNDLSAGFASNNNSSSNTTTILCLIPHALLSLSSLIFHTEKERVVGKPMIWSEFRAHNIIFGMRSILCSFLAWTSSYHHHEPKWRNMAVYTSSLVVLSSCWAADYATSKLRTNHMESTTATMPYWETCSPTTMYIFKYFYALAQFGATMTCLLVSNPSWPFAVLLPIQGASFLMTLVRKGLISAYMYHVLYLGSLLLVFMAGIRYILFCILVEEEYYVSLDLVVNFGIAFIAYQLRRNGWNKYAIWIPIVACRLIIGDDYIHWDIW